jgi:hypothetical protein
MSAALEPSAVASIANLFQLPHAPAPLLAASASSASTAEPRAPLELKRKTADAAASETDEKRPKVWRFLI